MVSCCLSFGGQSSTKWGGVQPRQHDSRALPTIPPLMPAISFQNVSKTYHSARGDVHALDRVSFDIAPGEFFGLLGPNGAGKTTLISILAGLARATGGRVLVHGHDVVTDYAITRRSLGVVPQELVFDPFFSVREALRIQSGYFGVRHNDAWIDELLANLGLADKANANMRQLSGGMKRRVLVAQALVHGPPVIVLDEPTAGVDVEQVLATLRAAGCQPEDLEIGRADLEDVFLEIMQGETLKEAA